MGINAYWNVSHMWAYMGLLLIWLSWYMHVLTLCLHVTIRVWSLNRVWMNLIGRIMFGFIIVVQIYHYFLNEDFNKINQPLTCLFYIFYFTLNGIIIDNVYIRQIKKQAQVLISPCVRKVICNWEANESLIYIYL